MTSSINSGFVPAVVYDLSPEQISYIKEAVGADPIFIGPTPGIKPRLVDFPPLPTSPEVTESEENEVSQTVKPRTVETICTKAKNAVTAHPYIATALSTAIVAVGAILAAYAYGN